MDEELLAKILDWGPIVVMAVLVAWAIRRRLK